ncbi:MAG: hypothetical protein PHW34_14365 [Hespellia sp.]|nr:hypothetical protein [Hespellia sp.]
MAQKEFAKYNVKFGQAQMKTLDIGQTTSGRLIKQMIGNGQIVQEGKGKNTHYCLPE